MEASLPPLGILAAGAQHGVASELRTRRLNGMKTDTAVAHISSAVRGGGGGGWACQNAREERKRTLDFPK